MGMLTVFTYVLAFVPWAVHAANSCDPNGSETCPDLAPSDSDEIAEVIQTTLLQTKQEIQPTEIGGTHTPAMGESNQKQVQQKAAVVGMSLTSNKQKPGNRKSATAVTPAHVDGSSGYTCGESSTWLGTQNESFTWTYMRCAALIVGHSSCDKVTESCDFDPSSCSDLSDLSNAARRRSHLTTPCTSLCSQLYFLVGSDGNCGCIIDDTGCSDSAQWSTQSGVSIYSTGITTTTTTLTTTTLTLELVDGTCGESSTWLGTQNEGYTWTYTDCAALIAGSSSCDKVTESCDFDPNSCSDLSSTRRRSHLTTPCTSLCSQSYFLVGSDGNCGCIIDDTGCSDSAQWSTQSGVSIYSM